MSRKWILFALGLLLVLGGGLLARSIQTAGGTEIRDVRIELGEGRELSALLYVPEGASAETPAPGVLAVHGYINSRETQSGFAIEFARRGYVVLALDQTGHGYSDGPAFSDAFGGPAALAYLRGLEFVDPDNIGLEGHSMGGWTVLNAAAAMPDGYRSIVLEGSSTGPGFAPPGTPESPRNLAVVFSKYDEFAPLMWGVARAQDVAQSEKLQGVFGTDQPVEVRRVYGDIDAGNARWLTTPNTTHPGDHISHEAIGDAVEWFWMTLEGGNGLARENQIWMWKEIGTLIALVGAVVLLLGTFELVLAAPFMEEQQRAGVGGAGRASPVWVVSLLLATLVPGLTYFLFTEWGSVVSNNPVFPQNITNQVLAWALGNALLAVPALFMNVQPRDGSMLRLGAAGLASVAAVYLASVFSDALFKTDFRFWVVALKPLAGHHVLAFLAYLVPFTAFFYASQRMLQKSILLKESGVVSQYGLAILVSAGGVTGLLLIVYGALFATGQLPGTDPLFSVIAMQFAPVLTATAIISTFAWRRTNSAVPGAVMCGVLVTWYVVAGQAMHV